MSELDVLRARQDALEASNRTLLAAFRTVDGDAHTALEVAKQNVTLMTALRATQLEHGRAIAGLVIEVADVKADVADAKADVADVKADVGSLRAELRDGLAEVLRRLPPQ